MQHISYHNCIRQGKSKTKRIGDVSFQKQQKYETNEILKYKDKFTDTMLQWQQYVTEMDTSTTLFIWHLLSFFFHNFRYGFRDLP